MLLRLTSALLLLFLAGCATTATETSNTVQTTPEPVIQPEPILSSTATIDEHLFVPEAEPTPLEAVDVHVHDSVWERLVHNFALPECTVNEKSEKWAQWYSERP